MNNEYLLIDCPELSENRVSDMVKTIEKWMKSDVLINLVKEFDGNIPENLNLMELSDWMVEFSEVWDYRKKQKDALDIKTGENARWLVDDDKSWPDEKRNMIIESARKLGLIDVLEPKEDYYDYFLVLGGARLSCLLRPQFAAELVYDRKFSPKKIVLLATSRDVSSTERSTTDTYAPDAVTEFDLIVSGAKNVFKLGEVAKDVKCDDANKNKSWRIIEYSKNGLLPEVLAISAPSSEPDKRRANSADTYEFFFKKYQIEKGAKLLLFTSQIYVPYQHMEAIRTLAFKFDVEIETIGVPGQWSKNLKGMRNSVHYLQEIRGTIISINKFLSNYY